MSDGYIQVPPDSTGKKTDTEELTVGSNTVNRQRIVACDPIDPAGRGRVKNVPPAAGDYAAVVRDAPIGLAEVAVAFSTSGDHTMIAAVAGQVIKVWRLLLWSNGSNTLTLRDGATVLCGPLDLAQGGQLKLDKDSDPWFTCATNSPFVLNTSDAVSLSGRLYYTQG